MQPEDITRDSALCPEVPKGMTFHLPEGLYRARITRIENLEKKPKNSKGLWVRFLFEVQIPSLSHKMPMARRCFESTLEERSDLRHFLEQWLGPKFLDEKGGQRFRLLDLIGRELDIQLRHLKTEKYEKPLVLVERGFEKGTVKLTEEPLGPDQDNHDKEDQDPKQEQAPLKRAA